MYGDDDPKIQEVATNKKAPVTGWYNYYLHVDATIMLKEKCDFPGHCYREFLQKGETAPTTGYCKHDVRWQLEEEYKTKRSGGVFNFLKHLNFLQKK